MKLIVLVFCVIAAVSAAPPNKSALAALRALPALEHEEVHDEFGQYSLRYATAEGTVVTERGRLVPTPDGKSYVLITEGEVSYVSDDGKTYVTKYSSDLDGSHVQGAHLPVAPEPITVIYRTLHEFGQYSLRYATAEGTVVTERGRLVPTPDGKSYVLITEGEVSYVSDDGKTYVTKYSSDLDGSHVQGAHLPVAPEPITVQ